MMHLYTLKTCDSCRKATKWLKEKQIPFEEYAIREKAPSEHELRQALSHHRDIRKLFNVSGQDYRNLQIKDQLPTMSDNDAIKLLASNGNLIKRPFIVHENTAIAGFDHATWSQVLS